MLKPGQSALAQREARPPDLPIAQKEIPLQMPVPVGSITISHLTATMTLVTPQSLLNTDSDDCWVHGMPSLADLLKRMVVTLQN